jgi:hypothetical protein
MSLLRKANNMPEGIPRGVEVLIKKAAVDPAFKKMLVEKRAPAAETIALKLEPAEAAMLDAVPLPQLEAIVANMKVDAKLRPAFLGYAAGVMLAALSTAILACDGGPFEPPSTLGSRPDPPKPPPGTAEPVDDAPEEQTKSIDNSDTERNDSG